MDNVIQFPGNEQRPWAMAPDRAEVNNLHTEVMLLAQLNTDLLDRMKKQDRQMADLEAQNRILSEELTVLSSLVRGLLKRKEK